MSVAYSGLKAHASFSVGQIHDRRHTHAQELIAEETPIALSYNGQSFAVMMATPQDLEDFALGFSLSEGIVARRTDINELKVERHPEGIVIEMKIEAARFTALDARQRNLTGRTGCGLCGARSLEQAIRHPDALTRQVALTHEAVQTATRQLSQQQPLNARSGSLHAAGWAHLDGSIACVREDVGRHNALDKLIGALIANDTDFAAGFLVMTSRASYELIQKAAMVGISALVAVSAPTALAIRLAQEVGMLLIGFARPGRHTVYAQPQRIIETTKEALA